MIVSALHDGHGTYGLRIPGGRVGLWFRPEWRWVTLYLPGESRPACVTLTDGFWGDHPELRSPRIREFLLRNGLVSWEKKQPPHFDLEPLGGGRFRLQWLERRERQPRLGMKPRP